MIGYHQLIKVPAETLQLVRLHRELLLAPVAQFSSQALGNNAVQRTADKERFDAHFDEPVRSSGSVIGVDGGKHEVAGQGGFDGDPGRLAVPYFPDQDDVRVRPQDRPQSRREGEPGLVVDLDLVDPVELVLNWVLDRDHVLGNLVQDVQGGVQRCRLPRTGRARNEHGAVGLGVRELVPFHVVR